MVDNSAVATAANLVSVTELKTVPKRVEHLVDFEVAAKVVS